MAAETSQSNLTLKIPNKDLPGPTGTPEWLLFALFRALTHMKPYEAQKALEDKTVVAEMKRSWSGQRRVAVDHGGNQSFGNEPPTSEPSVTFPRERATHAPLRNTAPVVGARCSAGRLKGSFIFLDYSQAWQQQPSLIHVTGTSIPRRVVLKPVMLKLVFRQLYCVVRNISIFHSLMITFHFCCLLLGTNSVGLLGRIV